jgi:tetratricopeptide (TPR) repeat protein
MKRFYFVLFLVLILLVNGSCSNPFIKNDSLSASQMLNIGFAYTKEKDNKNALKYYNLCVEKFPQNESCYSERGSLYLRTGKLDLALNDLNTSIDLNSLVSNAYNIRGLILFEQKEYLSAINDFTKAIEIEQSEALYYYHRGMIYYELESYSEALKDFNSAIKWESNWSSYYYWRGKVKLKMNDHLGACEDFDIFLNFRNVEPTKEMELLIQSNCK